MGDIENAQPGPGNDPGSLTHAFHALLEGAVAPRPPAPPDCPYCDLPQDRRHTGYPGHWILLEPRVLIPAHTVPPRRRWIITSDGIAMNLWDAEPLTGTLCCIPHSIVCPQLLPQDLWPWVTALRHHNKQRRQRLFDLPHEDLPDTA
ncbi:DUF6083 domain-containing protein [Streptomyces clavifer]|uniref:DUF6083 domain-containing protein n=1 Tax=Streptomyces clavifer TaxID=68188 RepID=UPI003093002F|nr:DUF6083 domain-containing protein [Streptomyces clavifer]